MHQKKNFLNRMTWKPSDWEDPMDKMVERMQHTVQQVILPCLENCTESIHPQGQAPSANDPSASIPSAGPRETTGPMVDVGPRAPVEPLLMTEEQWAIYDQAMPHFERFRLANDMAGYLKFLRTFEERVTGWILENRGKVRGKVKS